MARKTKAEAEATRASLLDAAERLFEARGVAHTSLQQIADEAGVTRGAVYWHFRDKADLFRAMMGRLRLPMEEPLSEGDAAPDRAAALAGLRRRLLQTLRQVVDDEQVRRVFEIAMHKVEYVGEMTALRERHRQAIDDYCTDLARALRRAGCTPAQARRHAEGLHAVVAGLIHTWMMAPGRFDLMAIGRHAIDTHLAGLRLPA